MSIVQKKTQLIFKLRKNDKIYTVLTGQLTTTLDNIDFQIHDHDERNLK